MDFTLRPAVASDIDWLVELRAVVLRDDLERLGRYDAVRVRERMRSAFDPDRTRIIVVAGHDAGSVTVREADDLSLWIEHFYLEPAVQGGGIGGRVLRQILSESDRVLRLNVLQGSTAERLYARAGFVVESFDEVDIFMVRHPNS